MTDSPLNQELAEQYLDEMLRAQQNDDYNDFLKRWPSETKQEFTRDDFDQENAQTMEELGLYKSRDYIGCIVVDDTPGEAAARYAWRATWDKAQALIIVGLFEEEGQVYVDENMNHSGDNNMYVMLLNA